MDDNQLFINDFATRSFRDYADQDYIMARIAYRKEFDQQFRWCSLQSIEKYLKAILLYNSKSAKNLGHNLEKALTRVKAIDDLNFAFPAKDCDEFVTYLTQYGADRYLSYPTHLKDRALLTLDKTVWCVRRYCFFMRTSIEHNGKLIELFEKNREKATNPYFEEKRHKYKLHGGYLEKVINKGLPGYDDLVWKNFFYGKVKKHQIKNVKFRMSSVSPTHSVHPEAFDTLSQVVDFPKVVKNAYEN